jgi:glycosyltransferase involved in cell wall biosynthesis
MNTRGYNMKKIQILLSTYNGEKFLKEQLESLINQTYGNVKILVRDDGSTDGTQSILKSYEEDGYIEFYIGKNIGACASFFELVKKADINASYFAFSDQDDFWKPEKIEIAIAKLEKEDDKLPVIYCSKTTVVDDKLNIITTHKQKTIKRISFGNSIVENIATGCTIVANKTMIKEMQKVNNTNGIFLHDWFAYMIATAFGKIIYDSNSYILYRQHSNNVIGLSKNTYEDYKRKVKLLFMYVRTKIIYNNTYKFYEIYSSQLKDSDIVLIKNFLSKRMFQKLKVVFSLKIKRQSWIDNIIFKVLFVLGML